MKPRHLVVLAVLLVTASTAHAGKHAAKLHRAAIAPGDAWFCFAEETSGDRAGDCERTESACEDKVAYLQKTMSDMAARMGTSADTTITMQCKQVDTVWAMTYLDTSDGSWQAAVAPTKALCEGSLRAPEWKNVSRCEKLTAKKRKHR